MTTKLQYYSNLAESAASKVTGSRRDWTGFLETAARLYKYPFEEQLMIYAQRPDATACATLETWNRPMNRWVRRGSKGIALIDTSGTRPHLKYVFDVSDTEAGRQNARKPFLWEMKPEHEGVIMEALGRSYGDMEGDLGNILHNIAKELANEYYEDNARDIGYSVENSFLEELDDFNVGVSFKEALTISTAYSLIYRCGLDTAQYFEDEDFQCIFDFNTMDTVNALGTAVSDLSQQVLREIGVTIRNYERQKAAERSMPHGELDIQPRRGLSDPGRDAERTAGESDDRQIRDYEEELSEGTPEDIIQFPGTEGTAISPSAGDRPDGGQEARAVDDGTVIEEPGPGQGRGSDGLDTAHEQPESTGGRTGSDGTDIRLNDDVSAEIPPGQDEPEPGGISLPEQPERELYKYYSVRRPIDIGTYPRANEPLEIVNFDDRQPVEDGAFQAWGYLLYNQALTEAQVQDYDLRTAPGNPSAAAEMPQENARESVSQQDVQTYSQVGNMLNREEQTPPVPVTPLAETLAGSSISPETVDVILRDGGNRNNSLHVKRQITPKPNVILFLTPKS